ncbi:MAG: hypothetical protein H0W83_12540 [Planctomycetes bacterium]|nr:hypothetical protein [Planctomycetota bacterium]
MRGFARLLATACLLAVVIVGGGCYGERKPIPVVTVAVLPEDDAFLYNGERMTWKQVGEELRQVAEHNRREKTQNSRAVVRLASRPGADYSRVRAVEEYCNSIGLDKIEKGD